MTEIVEIAKYVLEALKAAGADDAQCSVQMKKKDELNVEDGKFSLMRSTLGVRISMGAIKDGKKGNISINQTTKEAIDRAAAQCIAAADSAIVDEAEQIAPFSGEHQYSAGVQTPDLDKLFDRTKELLEQAKAEFPKVVFEQLISAYGHADAIYMNTNGTILKSSHGEYAYGMTFSAHDDTGSSSFNGYSNILTDLDKPFMDIGMQRSLLADSEKQISTVPVGEKFVGKVIYSPDCVGDLLGTVIQSFVSSGVLIDGSSPWKDMLNKKVASEKLTLRNVPLDERITARRRFTSDGYLADNFEIIKDGVLKAFVLSLYGANKTGFPRSPSGASNLEVLPGDTSLEEMIKGIDRGLLVNRISGGNPASNGDFSAVAKNSFIIENGKIGSAVSETMISGNIRDMLNSIVAISREQENDGTSLIPWVEFDGVTVSGKK